MKVISGLYPGVTTVELDNLAAETAATMTTKHPDYALLAARIAVSNLHKETKKVFSGKTENNINTAEISDTFLKGIIFKIYSSIYDSLLYYLFKDVMDDLYNYVNPKTNKHSPMISKKLHEIVTEHKDVRNSFIT